MAAIDQIEHIGQLPARQGQNALIHGRDHQMHVFGPPDRYRKICRDPGTDNGRRSHVKLQAMRRLIDPDIAKPHRP